MIVCRAVGRSAMNPTDPQLSVTFPRLNGLCCRNDVRAFSGIGLCNAGSGRAKGQRCSGVFQKNTDATGACRGLNSTDTIPWSTILVQQAIWTSLASQRTGQVNQRAIGKRLGFFSQARRFSYPKSTAMMRTAIPRIITAVCIEKA